MPTPDYLVATTLLMLAAVTSSIPSDARFAHNQIGFAQFDTEDFSALPSMPRALLAHASDRDQSKKRHSQPVARITPGQG